MQIVETLFRQIHQLPPQEKEKLYKMLDVQQSAESNGGQAGKDRHFQETATDQEWHVALYQLANDLIIVAPDISDEALRRENIYTREDSLL